MILTQAGILPMAGRKVWPTTDILERTAIILCSVSPLQESVWQGSFVRVMFIQLMARWRCSPRSLRDTGSTFKRFWLRGDAAFVKPELHSCCEAKRMTYFIRLKLNNSLKKLIEPHLTRPFRQETGINSAEWCAGLRGMRMNSSLGSGSL